MAEFWVSKIFDVPPLCDPFDIGRLQAVFRKASGQACGSRPPPIWVALHNIPAFPAVAGHGRAPEMLLCLLHVQQRQRQVH